MYNIFQFYSSKSYDYVRKTFDNVLPSPSVKYISA